MTFAKPLTLAIALLALAACGSKQQPTYETGQKDLVVENPTDPAVPVNLPTTAMTNAPVDASAATAPAKSN